MQSGERKEEKAKAERKKNLCRESRYPNVVGEHTGGPNLSVDTHLPPMCEKGPKKTGVMRIDGVSGLDR
jgi:hypothetical protein